MKTVHKAVVYLLYAVSLPIVALFTMIMLIWSVVYDLRHFGTVELGKAAKALFEGYFEGHKRNMTAIDEIWSKHDEEAV